MDITESLRMAEQGDLQCQRFLAKFYQNGSDAPKDYLESVKWWSLAADQGDAEAQVALGQFFFYGTGVTRDFAEAVKWYRKAAVQGRLEALVLLGKRYIDGFGTEEPDLVEAYAYFNLVSVELKSARGARDELEGRLSLEEVLRGQRRTKELKKEIEANIASKRAEDVKKAGK